MSRTLRSLVLLLALLPLEACCLLCGTSKEPLVPLSYDSPEDCLESLLAAIRHSDSQRIYESLSEDFKRRKGFDAVGLHIAWERMIAEEPYLQVAGLAKVLATEKPGRYRRIYLMGIYGQRFEILIRAYPYWDVGIFDPSAGGGNSDIAEIGGGWPSPRELQTEILVRLEEGRLDMSIQDEDLLDYEKDDIAYVHLGRTWKVDDIRSPAKEEEATAKN